MFVLLGFQSRVLFTETNYLCGICSGLDNGRGGRGDDDWRGRDGLLLGLGESCRKRFDFLLVTLGLVCLTRIFLTLQFLAEAYQFRIFVWSLEHRLGNRRRNRLLHVDNGLCGILLA